MVSRKGSQVLGVDGFTGAEPGVTVWAGFESRTVEPGVTAAAEMAGFAVSLPGRPGFFTVIPAWRR